jgi:hypothetical protein
VTGEVFALRARCGGKIKEPPNELAPPYYAVQEAPIHNYELVFSEGALREPLCILNVSSSLFMRAKDNLVRLLHDTQFHKWGLVTQTCQCKYCISNMP